MTTLAANPAASRSQSRVLPAALAILVGAALYLVAGFAWPDAVHNATHDTRHSLGLPCH